MKDTNSAGPADTIFRFGPAGVAWDPVSGDWDGIGTDTVGLYDPTAGKFFLKDSNSTGVADSIFRFGPAGAGWTALAGDWDSATVLGEALESLAAEGFAAETAPLGNPFASRSFEVEPGADESQGSAAARHSAESVRVVLPAVPLSRGLTRSLAISSEASAHALAAALSHTSPSNPGPSDEALLELLEGGLIESLETLQT